MMAQKSFKKNLTFWIPAKHNKVHVSKVKANQVTTFQSALRVTVITGQIFSLMPFVGVFSDKASDIKFVKTSWKCMYTCLSIFGQCFMTVMCFNKLLHSTVTLMGTTPFIFYVTTVITMLMFFQVARNWPALVQAISKTEELDPNFDKKLTKKCNITCFVVLFLALAEHILSLLSAFAGAEICYTKLGAYEGFVRHFYPWVFNNIPYSPLLGITTQFLHFQSTFIWNFSDLFVICVSYYLTSRLEQVNKKLLAAQGKYLPEVFWRSTREEYGRATQLVRKVDDVINGIVLISFANNLFFICLQLFNTLEDGIKGTGECSSRAKKNTVLGGYEAAVYFIFSLVYLITRSIAVSLIASQVNTASDVPAPVLYDVPSPVYCVETFSFRVAPCTTRRGRRKSQPLTLMKTLGMSRNLVGAFTDSAVQRFLDQVNGDMVALSGMQFFSVTRGLLLTVAGTIVTYELVMFQFTSPSPSPNSTILPDISTTVATLRTT